MRSANDECCREGAAFPPPTRLLPPPNRSVSAGVTKNAAMTEQGLHNLGIDGLDLVFLENVGNLICPAEFDTGAGAKVMILSSPEGHDKPLKYPLMFEVSDLVIVSKMDVAPYFDFDLGELEKNVRLRNPNATIMPLSAKTGEGMDAWCDWLRTQVTNWKG